ncbi:Hypothetical predicted protein [Pelobates cultripes]|uniref:Uncharacterized protein n=1 Tax=Pelobates cultripes TaxID=61616 RepID=A0AAD1WTK7_PELCU|nr:Hypothetical predicted protein [Pelobates cultripes]
MLRSEKIILLASDSHFERSQELKALQEKLVLLKRRSSDGPLVREQSILHKKTVNIQVSPMPLLLQKAPTFNEEVDVLGDIDSFIDSTFNGITFNRQSQMIKNDIWKHIPNQDANFR